MTDDERGFELLTITFYGLADADKGNGRALLAGVTVHGYLPDITPGDVQECLLAMAASLPPQLAAQWAHDEAWRN